MTANWFPANWVPIGKSLNSGNFYSRRIYFAFAVLEYLLDPQKQFFLFSWKVHRATYPALYFVWETECEDFWEETQVQVQWNQGPH